MQAVDAKPEARDLLGALTPDQESHVASGLDQPAAEIATQRPRADHQDPHDALLAVQADGFPHRGAYARKGARRHDPKSLTLPGLSRRGGYSSC